tara:strand:+ start:1082 stop:1831 length:750 start_codon:yes stop_codon:yes gene_type:complete
MTIKWEYLVIVVIVFSVLIRNDNFKSNVQNFLGINSAPKYTYDQKRVIETCEFYAKELYNIEFKSTPDECYTFLNIYREGVNDQVDRLYNILKNAYTYSNMSPSKILTLGTAVKSHMRTYDCRFKKFRSPDRAEELVPCMVSLENAPKALIGFIEKTNDYNRIQAARSLSRSMQKTTGDKLIEMGLILMGTGSGSGGSSGSNFNTKCSYTGSSTSGPTTTCSYNCAGKRKVISQTNNPICPYNVKGSIF